VNFLAALEKADNATGRKYFLMHFPHNHFSNNFTSYREGDWKLIQNYNEQGEKAFELYDMKNDFIESKNLASALPERLKEMIKAMKARLDAVDAQYAPAQKAKVKKKKVKKKKN